MYSETDLQAAVDAKVLTPEAAAAFRSHIASVRSAPAADEESFRLITGFNDIFVSIAAVILLVAVGWIGESIHPALAGAFVAGSVDGTAARGAVFRVPARLLGRSGLLGAVAAVLRAALAALRGAAAGGLRSSVFVVSGHGCASWVGLECAAARRNAPIDSRANCVRGRSRLM